MILCQKRPSRFNGFLLHILKPLKRLITFLQNNTGLKSGVNYLLPRHTAAGLKSGVNDIGARSRPTEKLTGINIAG